MGGNDPWNFSRLVGFQPLSIRLYASRRWQPVRQPVKCAILKSTLYHKSDGIGIKRNCRPPEGAHKFQTVVGKIRDTERIGAPGPDDPLHFYQDIRYARNNVELKGGCHNIHTASFKNSTMATNPSDCSILIRLRGLHLRKSMDDRALVPQLN